MAFSQNSFANRSEPFKLAPAGGTQRWAQDGSTALRGARRPEKAVLPGGFTPQLPSLQILWRDFC